MIYAFPRFFLRLFRIIPSISTQNPQRKLHRASPSPFPAVPGRQSTGDLREALPASDAEGANATSQGPAVVFMGDGMVFCMLTLWLFNNYGKSPFLIGKPSINGPFSMAMSNNQRVMIPKDG